MATSKGFVTGVQIIAFYSKQIYSSETKYENKKFRKEVSR